MTEGSVILLQTAPIDPRSLMQGDYMALRFQEGDAGLYSKARYGEFRAGADGESILTGMRDEQLSRLGNSLGN